MDNWRLQLKRARKRTSAHYVLSRGELRIALIPVADRVGYEFTGDTHFTLEVRSACCTQPLATGVGGVQCRRCNGVSVYGDPSVTKLALWRPGETAPPNLAAALAANFNPLTAQWHESTVLTLLEQLRHGNHAWMAQTFPLTLWHKLQFRPALTAAHKLDSIAS